MDDCTQEWTFAPGSFDYIHLRWLLGSIADWSELFAQAYRACRPGGWIETFEPRSGLLSDDGSVTDKTVHGQWGKVFTAGANITGRTFDVVQLNLQKKGMEEAGFVDIQERLLKVRSPSPHLGFVPLLFHVLFRYTFIISVIPSDWRC
jgi:hypothetical protein